MPYSDISLRIDEDVDQRLTRLNDELRDASAQTILRASILREWTSELTYVSSFGAESAVMLALIADVDPDLPIVFLETGMHFPQTLDYKEELIERLGLTNVRDIPPSEEERLAEDPKNTLWKTDPDACCALRKVRPLEQRWKALRPGLQVANVSMAVPVCRCQSSNTRRADSKSIRLPVGRRKTYKPISNAANCRAIH